MEKKHQRALGMSMRVERSSLDQVRERLEVLEKRKVPGSFSEQDLDERIIKQQEEEEERKRQCPEKKKEKKKEKAAVEEETEIDPDIAATFILPKSDHISSSLCYSSRIERRKEGDLQIYHSVLCREVYGG